MVLYLNRRLTYSRSSTEIQQDFGLFQKAILLVQLNQFEGGSGSVSLLLGQFIPFIETTLAVLLLDTHGCEVGGIGVVWRNDLEVSMRTPKFFAVEERFLCQGPPDTDKPSVKRLDKLGAILNPFLAQNKHNWEH